MTQQKLLRNTALPFAKNTVRVKATLSGRCSATWITTPIIWSTGMIPILLVRGLINWLFKSNVRDIMTGQRAFSHDFVKSFPVISKGFQVETEMTIHTLDKNLKWSEVSIEYRDRPEGSVSKLNTVSDGIRVITTIFNMMREFKPVFFFGISGLIVFAIGLVLGFFPVREYFETGSVSKFPSLIVAGVLWVIALLLWSIGLITDTINKKYRQQYEINLNILRKIS
jgi:hypothetical protein